MALAGGSPEIGMGAPSGYLESEPIGMEKLLSEITSVI